MNAAPFVDACVHHQWAGESEVVAYMSEGWREWVGKPGRLQAGRGHLGSKIGTRPLALTTLWTHPEAKVAVAMPPTSGNGDPTGVTVGADLRYPFANVERLILTHGSGLPMPASTNAYLATEIVRATNDWTVDKWLSDQDSKVFASILVPNQVPDDAAQEIVRLGKHPRMVAVSMGANGLAKPLGHPVYHPIYAAAVDAGLPVIIHAGLEGICDVTAETAAGGVPATYAEYQLLAGEPFQTHLMSLIVQGVFEKFRQLRVVFSGAGVTWLAAILWRMDMNYRGMRKEAPWLKRLPSEYFRESVRIITHRFDRAGEPTRLFRLLAALDITDDLLIFGSGFPSLESNTPSELIEQLPSAWRPRVMRENALSLFRWGRVAV